LKGQNLDKSPNHLRILKSQPMKFRQNNLTRKSRKVSSKKGSNKMKGEEVMQWKEEKR